jgi:rubrerythrin
MENKFKKFFVNEENECTLVNGENFCEECGASWFVNTSDHSCPKCGDGCWSTYVSVMEDYKED